MTKVISGDIQVRLARMNLGEAQFTARDWIKEKTSFQLYIPRSRNSYSKLIILAEVVS